MEFMESYMLEPFMGYDIQDIIKESSFDVDDYLMTESAGTTKKNLLSRLWGMVKQIFKMIGIKIKEVCSGIKSFFTGSGKKITDHTIDQIAEEVLGKKEVTDGSKHLNFYYDNGKQICINYIGNFIASKFKETKVAGHDKKDRPEQQAIALIFNIVKQPGLLVPIIDMVKSIKENNGQIKFDIKKLQNSIDRVWAQTTISMVKLSCSMDSWTELNTQIIELNNAMQTIDDITFAKIVAETGTKDDEKLWAETMNKLVRLTSFMQKGINAVGDGMRQVYELDPKYRDQITSENFQKYLPKFVYRCIQSNIPGKYIHLAIRTICDKSINAKVSDANAKADERGYLKGNGRFVIFPGDSKLQDKVIKIAYNGLGIRGNRSEFEIYKKVKGIPDIANELYHVYDINDPNFCVIMADRVTPLDNYKEADKWNARMKEYCIDNNVGFIIRCNAGGFGKTKDGKVICVDFGNVHLLSRK